MSHKYLRPCALYITSLLLSGGMLSLVVADEPPQKVYVSYEDIPSRVNIIGKLGRPLGELMTISGRWRAGGKEKPAMPIVFVVDHLDGKELKTAVEFSLDDTKPAASTSKQFAPVEGQRWEFRGVETGGFVGYSDEVWRALGAPTVSRTASGFITTFRFFSACEIAAPQGK